MKYWTKTAIQRNVCYQQEMKIVKSLQHGIQKRTHIPLYNMVRLVQLLSA